MKKALPILYPIIFLVVFAAVISFNSGSIFGYKFQKAAPASDSIASSTPIIDQFSLDEIKKIFPEAASYKVTNEDKSSVFDSNNQQIGEALHTLPISNDIKGFAAAIPMIIGIDKNNQIQGIVVLKNNETPAFLDKVISTGLLDKWKGKNPDEAANLKVDAVTGATMSSSAIIKSIQTRLSGKKAGQKEEKDQFTLEEIKIIFPNASSYQKLSENRAIVLDDKNQKIGEALHTLPDCKDLKGFAGNIPMIIGIDTNDKITGIVTQKNNETLPFFQKVIDSGILDKWKNQIASEAINLKVDAVTGATLSSSCIINSVKTRVTNHIDEIKKEKEQLIKKYWDWAYETLAWVFLALSVFAYMPKSSVAKYRKTILAISVVIPGFVLARFVSLGLLKAWVSDGIPYSTQIFMTVLVTLAITLPLITGRAFYCIWYCPFGAAQELCGNITKKKYTPTGKVANFLKKIRPVFLTIILLLILFGINIDIYQFEPFSAFMFRSASVIVLSLAVVFLILSIFIRRPWCNYFCPTGQFLENCRKKKDKA
ncbi:MAG: FMN-binding protein [Candidatus Riflebacteria bacterium]|nr:FMN-binding protein [Candidatus Riflebacteria bacterium]